ncbi:secretion/DNA translocation related CpaE-like protein [Arthrobacter pigmenti]|uniref:Secretion/DNA translocation related CpaE-like protein n=1 Tax=Arthrobacter pigmenti TaxID=271432 RepID=A0A846RS96_9MICC|nr:septum site-determining protein Ssd [Arthrobacter pigmenti]NJC23422.1 secretion/DNA translocation related CpaE-like protein [Arthrobacter pigmenti]
MSSWIPSPEAGAVVLVASSQQIRDEVTRVAVAAGLDLALAGTVTEALGLRPAVVLLDAGNAHHAVTGSDMVVVGLEGEESQAWAAATRCGADRVAVLPQASGWLAEHLGKLQRARDHGTVLGVLGAVGGAGASSVSCWLAAGAAASGMRTLLVDGDPLGGGLEVTLGSELLPGVRWPDLGEVRGTLNPDQLIDALPSLDGLALLSMGTEPPNPGILGTPAVAPVMQAARAAFDLAVVDAARGWSADGSLLPYCDSVLLVVPGRVRAVSAARATVAQLQPLAVRVVVRGPLGPDLDPRRVADAVGVPSAGYLPHLRGASAAENQGRILELARHRSVRSFGKSVLSTVLPGTSPAVA